MSTPDIEIITYGGGDILRMVFNAIAMLFYGNKQSGSFIHPLCVTTAMIGGAWSISRCFFQSYTDAFVTKYFLPLLAIPTLLIVPQARVHIIDKLHDKPIVVDHVPLIFAKITGISSSWGYEITQAIEKVMHTPNDVKYSKTGMIFGADAALDFSRMKLNNSTLAQNLHQFTQQCIIYDVALGRYTIDELRKSTNLLHFLKKNTSHVRMIPYTNHGDKKVDFLTCVESLDAMSPLFDKEVSYYTKHEIFKKLPVAYQTLLNFKEQSENNISGQLSNAAHGSTEAISKDIVVVNAFDNAMSRFATERARANQRSTYQVAGSLAGHSLVTMRIIFEALIYASCALILPLSLLPGGIRFIGSWIFLNIWIQLWPPLYAILNYITMLCSQRYAHSVMGGVSDGFSLFTSAGFQDMAYDAAALGGYLSLSVPLLSFYLLQNLQSMVHLTSSLMTPAYSAAGTAAAELSTGNYSFANTSVGQMSYDNQTSFQQNSAPTLSAGFFTDNHGIHQVKYGKDRLTVNQDLSNLNTSISTADAYSSSLQKAMQNAETKVDSKQSLYTETRGIAERSTADLVQHVASSEMFSNGHSTSDTLAVQESANWVTNAAKNWGAQHGVSGRESLEYFASMGLEWPVVLSAKAGHSENCNITSDEARHSAESIFNSNDFQEHYQHVLNSTQNESTSNMTDEGKRFVENYMASSENLKSAQDQFSSAYSELNQISENLSFVESHSSTVNTNLNTEFSNWLNDRGSLGALLDTGRKEELDSLRDCFIGEKCQSEIGGLEKFSDPSSPSSSLPSIENEWSNLKENTRQKADEAGLSFGQTQSNQQGVLSQYDDQNIMISSKLTLQKQELNNLQNSFEEGFDKENQKIGIDRLNTKMGTNINNICNTPTNFSWFDDYANPQ